MLHFFKAIFFCFFPYIVVVSSGKRKLKTTRDRKKIIPCTRRSNTLALADEVDYAEGERERAGVERRERDKSEGKLMARFMGGKPP